MKIKLKLRRIEFYCIKKGDEMIEFLCNEKNIDINGIESWDYSELLKLECWFCIKINGEVFYEEPLFPILEFIYFYEKWDEDKTQNFVYNTIESEDNPMISFIKNDEKWSIDSVWRRFECKEVFYFGQLIGAVDKMLKEICQVEKNTIDALTKIIHTWDPINLMSFCPKDEYEFEITKIYKRILLSSQNNNISEIASAVNKIFVKAFGNLFTQSIEDCYEVAKEIMQLKAQEEQS